MTDSTPAGCGFNAEAGNTDWAWIRDITQDLTQELADRLFTGRDADAAEDQLRQVAVEGLVRTYFLANDPRTHASALPTVFQLPETGCFHVR